MITKKTGTLIALITILTVLIGCSAQTAISSGEAVNVNVNALNDSGTIILRVNPEIAIHYNKAGLVTSLTGLNDDGEAIVNGYADYIGKDARMVLQDLVVDINEAGYFVSEIDGSTRSITIEIEPGSVLPQDDYMNVLAEDVQSTVERMNLRSNVAGIGPDAYDDTAAKNDLQDSMPEQREPLPAKEDRSASVPAGIPAADDAKPTTKPTSKPTSKPTPKPTSEPAATAKPSDRTAGNSAYSSYNSGYNSSDSGYSNNSSDSGYSNYSSNSGYSGYSSYS